MKNRSKVHVSVHSSSIAHCNRRGAAPRATIAAKIGSLDAPENCSHFAARCARVRAPPTLPRARSAQPISGPSLDVCDPARLLFALGGAPSASLGDGCPRGRAAGCRRPGRQPRAPPRCGEAAPRLRRGWAGFGSNAEGVCLDRARSLAWIHSDVDAPLLLCAITLIPLECDRVLHTSPLDSDTHMYNKMSKSTKVIECSHEPETHEPGWN